MTTTTLPWLDKRTGESCRVEQVLHGGGFDRADAYRYNSASIRVRVIDPRFEGLSLGKRDDMVKPLLKQLPDHIYGDIITLYTFAPSELRLAPKLTQEFILKAEFEDPSPSEL